MARLLDSPLTYFIFRERFTACWQRIKDFSGCELVMECASRHMRLTRLVSTVSLSRSCCKLSDSEMGACAKARTEIADRQVVRKRHCSRNGNCFSVLVREFRCTRSSYVNIPIKMNLNYYLKCGSTRALLSILDA